MKWEKMRRPLNPCREPRVAVCVLSATTPSTVEAPAAAADMHPTTAADTV